jgi:hypothetical protein
MDAKVMDAKVEVAFEFDISTGDVDKVVLKGVAIDGKALGDYPLSDVKMISADGVHSGRGVLRPRALQPTRCAS